MYTYQITCRLNPIAIYLSHRKQSFYNDSHGDREICFSCYDQTSCKFCFLPLGKNQLVSHWFSNTDLGLCSNPIYHTSFFQSITQVKVKAEQWDEIDSRCWVWLEFTWRVASNSCQTTIKQDCAFWGDWRGLAPNLYDDWKGKGGRRV